MTSPRWLNEQENRAWRSFRQLSTKLMSTLDKQLTSDSGLSGADYELLVVLSETSGHRLRARELRNFVEWDRSRLAHQVRRMEQRGLLRRTECETDARGTMIELTPQGLTVIQQAAPAHVEAVRRYLIDLLTPEQLDTLAQISARVLDRIESEPAS